MSMPLIGRQQKTMGSSRVYQPLLMKGGVYICRFVNKSQPTQSGPSYLCYQLTSVCPETCWNKWSHLKHFLFIYNFTWVPFCWVRTRMNLPHPIMLSSGVGGVGGGGGGGGPNISVMFTLTNTGCWMLGITVSLNLMTRMFTDMLISMETVHLWCLLLYTYYISPRNAGQSWYQSVIRTHVGNVKVQFNLDDKDEIIAHHHITITLKLEISMLNHWLHDTHMYVCIKDECNALQWRYNERNDVSNHQPNDCLLKPLFRRR